ncbi:MAG: phosphopantetheine-binding protein [Pseudomonadales bacterium]
MADIQPISGNVDLMVYASAVGDRLEQFVRSAFAVDPTDPGFDRNIDLFEAGFVDSVGLTELLAFIGDEYGANISDEQLLSDEFASIDGMALVICRELSAAGASVRPR